MAAAVDDGEGFKGAPPTSETCEMVEAFEGFVERVCPLLAESVEARPRGGERVLGPPKSEPPTGSVASNSRRSMVEGSGAQQKNRLSLRIG